MTRKVTAGQREVAREVATERGKVVPGSARRTKRRTRSPHPGVILIKPKGPRRMWRARFRDPDTGRLTYESLGLLAAGSNDETRKAWADAKAREIARRKDAIKLGAPRATGTTISDAIARYYTDHPRLRDRTRTTYQKATNKLKDWLGASGVRSADALTLAHLVAFRSSIASAPRQSQARGAKRGARKTTTKPRAASAVNVEIRSIKVALGYLRRVGLLPKISRDDISDGLRLLTTEQDAPDFLRPPQIGALLRAAIAHDADTFKATREEHALGKAGTTPRYPSIAPFIAVALLSGMRFGELESLDWSEVDAEGIHLTSRTKTKRARVVAFEVSPGLAALLAALRPERAAGSVWGLRTDQIKAAAKRLDKRGAPKGWTWQGLRRTCGTYLTNAPGIFGAASAYRSARQLGHSVQVAERHYLGVVRVPKEAATLEAAMGCEAEIEAIVREKRPRMTP